MTDGIEADRRPWSARRPQNVLLSLVFIVLAVFLVRQGVLSIAQGEGGFVPYLIIIGGPALACYYTWYFVFRRFGEDPS